MQAWRLVLDTTLHNRGPWPTLLTPSQEGSRETTSTDPGPGLGLGARVPSKYPPHSAPVKVTQSCVSDSLRPHGLYGPWNSPGQNTGVSSISLLQGIFLIQESNPGLPHCRQIPYQLSHQGSPRILEWVAYSFSRGSSQLRNQTGVSSIAGGFFTN